MNDYKMSKNAHIKIMKINKIIMNASSCGIKLFQQQTKNQHFNTLYGYHDLHEKEKVQN